MGLRNLKLRFLVLFGALVLAVPAAALAGQSSFALKPLKFDPAVPATRSYFILRLRPGQRISSRFVVSNVGTSHGTAFLYPVDATTGQTSGAVYLSRTSPRRDVGSWITLGVSRVKLAPGERRVVSFTLRVPARGLRPGDHLGGIVVENARLTTGSRSSPLRINIRHLTIDAVEVKVPGRAVRTVTIAGVTAGGGHGYQRVFVRLRNVGTAMLKPSGKLTVTDSTGRQVADRSFRLDTFLPQTQINYPVLLPGQALSPGSYRATVTLTFAGKTIRRTFPLGVTRDQYRQVFAGAAPARAPKSGRHEPAVLLPLLGAALAAALVALGFVYRRSLFT
jgi:Bacterial protein of unknown function (DUF916)